MTISNPTLMFVGTFLLAFFGSRLLQDAGQINLAIGVYGAGLFFCGWIWGANT